MSRRLANHQQRREARYDLSEKARAHREFRWRISLLKWAIRMAAASGHPLALEIERHSTHPRFADELDALTTYFNARPYLPARRRVRVRRVRAKARAG